MIRSLSDASGRWPEKARHDGNGDEHALLHRQLHAAPALSGRSRSGVERSGTGDDLQTPAAAGKINRQSSSLSSLAVVVAVIRPAVIICCRRRCPSRSCRRHRRRHHSPSRSPSGRCPRRHRRRASLSCRRHRPRRHRLAARAILVVVLVIVVVADEVLVRGADLDAGAADVLGIRASGLPLDDLAGGAVVDDFNLFGARARPRS